MNQNMPPMGPGAGPQMNPDINPASNQTSPAAIIALILSVVSLCTSLVCCAGLVPAGLAIALGIFAVVQARSGAANQASAVMGGISIVISGMAFVMYVAFFMLGLGSSVFQGLNESGDLPFDVPAMEQYEETTY